MSCFTLSIQFQEPVMAFFKILRFIDAILLLIFPNIVRNRDFITKLQIKIFYYQEKPHEGVFKRRYKNVKKCMLFSQQELLVCDYQCGALS